QRFDLTPTMGRLESYVDERLGIGLTPEERQAVLHSLESPIESSADQAYRNAASSTAAAGIDPRSGVAYQRAGEIAAQRQQGLTDARMQTELLNLQRKGEIEGLGMNVAQLQEAQRQ